MSDKLITGIVSVITAIIGVAIIAVLVSNHADTGSVLGAGGNAFSSILRCALSPVTGGSCSGGSTPSVSSSIAFPTIG